MSSILTYIWSWSLHLELLTTEVVTIKDLLFPKRFESDCCKNVACDDEFVLQTSRHSPVPNTRLLVEVASYISKCQR